jgi:hypothetical protein
MKGLSFICVRESWRISGVAELVAEVEMHLDEDSCEQTNANNLRLGLPSNRLTSQLIRARPSLVPPPDRTRCDPINVQRTMRVGWTEPRTMHPHSMNIKPAPSGLADGAGSAR